MLRLEDFYGDAVPAGRSADEVVELSLDFFRGLIRLEMDDLVELRKTRKPRARRDNSYKPINSESAIVRTAGGNRPKRSITKKT